MRMPLCCFVVILFSTNFTNSTNLLAFIMKNLRLSAFGLLLLLLVACATADPTAQTATATPEAAAPPTTAPPTAEPTPVGEPTPLPEPTPAGPLVQGTDGFPWWNDTVFYQIFVRSFYDSDGDGIGDINGIIEKLDYLNDGDPQTTSDLGITGIWLMPIMQSPSYHGYDTTDYYAVDDEYGTNEDFLRLMEEAHKRGIRVIVDLVINHSSREHPWFIESKDEDSEYRDWYIWEDENPGYRGPENQTVWHRTADGFYYAVFADIQPDLNLENPDVTEAIYDVSRFWLEDMGVDGFRLDAIKHLVEEGTQQEFTGATYEWMEAYYQQLKNVSPDAVTVGEAWGPTRQVAEFVGDGVDIAFEFDLALNTISSLRGGSNRALSRAQQTTVASFPPLQYATFLANHDQDRLFSQLDASEGKARTAATLLLTSPGVPFIYYGEEIGQQGVRANNTDINRRLPMQWTDEDAKAGFTTGVPWNRPFEDYRERNVAAQDGDPDSLLNHYRRLIALRNEHEALRVGDWLPVRTNAAAAYAYLRHSDDETILVLVNLTGRPIDNYGLELEEGPLTGELAAVSLLGEAELAAPAISETGGFVDYRPLPEIPPNGNYVIQLTAED